MSRAAWPPASVRDLLSSDGRVQRVAADGDYARRIVETVCEEELVLALFAAAREQWSKANTLTYDAARKAVEAALLAAGWRIRAVAGAHAFVGDVVDRWLGPGADPGPRIAARFSASRKARHDDEYPHPEGRRRSTAELRALAQDNVRLVNFALEKLEVDPRPDLVPTDANIDRFRRQ